MDLKKGKWTVRTDEAS